MAEESPLTTAQQSFAEKLPYASMKPESCELSHAFNRVLKSDFYAPMDSPPYSRAIVEGFLVNTEETKTASEDNPVTFTIAGVINPGDESALAPKNTSAYQVATGSIVANGNFSIVRMWEANKTSENEFTISRPFPPRFFIEDKGCEISLGDSIIHAGSKLDAEQIGLLASMGVNDISVSKRPRVSVFASGDEVIPHTEKFRPGYIFDCNSPMLAAAIENEGGEAILHGIQSDDFDSFLAKAKTALEDSDMLVISGGTAIGGRDFISDVIRSLGTLIVDGVPMRSGRPLIMGVANNKPIVCVAGHPPEALRGFKLFGKLAIDIITGHSKSLPEDQIVN